MLAPTLAEQARSAVSVASSASLATVDTDGRPVVAPVPIVDDGSGQPITVLSNLTTHTLRARRDRRAAMSVADRLLLQGELLDVPGLQQLELQPRFVALHPTLTEQVESLDFSWFRMGVDRVRWTDDDNDEHWLRPEDLFGAEPDPLADLTTEDIADVGERLDDELLLIIRSLGGRWLARSSELVRIDRYGIVAVVDEPGRRSRARVPFPERLESPAELHASLGALLRAARSSPQAGPDQVPFVETSRSSQGLDGPDLAFAALLDGVEGDRSGGADIETVDSATHGDSGSDGASVDSSIA